MIVIVMCVFLEPQYDSIRINFRQKDICVSNCGIVCCTDYKIVLILKLCRICKVIASNC